MEKRTGREVYGLYRKCRWKTLLECWNPLILLGSNPLPATISKALRLNVLGAFFRRCKVYGL